MSVFDLGPGTGIRIKATAVVLSPTVVRSFSFKWIMISQSYRGADGFSLQILLSSVSSFQSTMQFFINSICIF